MKIRGRQYGTADELAAELGPDITADMIRRYHERDGLTRVVLPGPGRGSVVFPLDEASAIERDKRLGKRLSGRGRPRRLDSPVPAG